MAQVNAAILAFVEGAVLGGGSDGGGGSGRSTGGSSRSSAVVLAQDSIAQQGRRLSVS